MDKAPTPAESTISTGKKDDVVSRAASVQNTAILFWVVLGMYLLFESYAPASVSSDSTYSILAKTLVRAAIALWAYADARARNYQREWLIILMIVTINLPEIVIPVYLVISRGWKGAAKSTLRFIGYLLLASVIWYGVVGVLEIFEVHEVGKPTIIFDRLHS